METDGPQARNLSDGDTGSGQNNGADGASLCVLPLPTFPTNQAQHSNSMNNGRGRGSSRATAHPMCQVPGCCKDLSGSRGYHQRYKICDDHFRVPSMELDGQVVRFCQQCGKFQPIADFHDDRRSCTIQLALHAGRRRKRHAAARARKSTGTANQHTIGSETNSDSDSGDRRNVRNRKGSGGSGGARGSKGGDREDGGDRGHSLTGLTEEEVHLLRGIIRTRGLREAAVAGGLPLQLAGGNNAHTVHTSSRAGSPGAPHPMQFGAPGMVCGTTGQDMNAWGGMALPQGQGMYLSSVPNPIMYVKDIQGPPTTAEVVQGYMDPMWRRGTPVGMLPRRHQNSVDSVQTVGDMAGQQVVLHSGEVTMQPKGGSGGSGSLQISSVAQALAQQAGSSGGARGAPPAGVALKVEELYPPQQPGSEGDKGSKRSSGLLETVAEQQQQRGPRAGMGNGSLVMGPDGSVMRFMDGPMVSGPQYLPQGNQLNYLGGAPALVLDSVSNGMGGPNHQHMGGTVVYGCGAGNGTWEAPRGGRFMPWNGGAMQPANQVRVVDIQQLQTVGSGCAGAGSTTQYLQTAAPGSGGGGVPGGVQLMVGGGGNGYYSTGPALHMTPDGNGGFYNASQMPIMAAGGMGGAGGEYGVSGMNGSNYSVTLITPEQLQELMRGATQQQQPQLQVQPLPLATAASS